MEEPSLTPGRSWTAKILAAVPGLFDPAAGTAVKRAIDKAGDFWHNTLLWDRVGDCRPASTPICRTIFSPRAWIGRRPRARAATARAVPWCHVLQRRPGRPSRRRTVPRPRAARLRGAGGATRYPQANPARRHRRREGPHDRARHPRRPATVLCPDVDQSGEPAIRAGRCAISIPTPRPSSASGWKARAERTHELFAPTAAKQLIPLARGAARSDYFDAPIPVSFADIHRPPEGARLARKGKMGDSIRGLEHPDRSDST